MEKIATICAILEDPASNQKEFNDLVSAYQHMIRGRMGIPFDKENVAAISLTVVGKLDEINSFTGKIGKIPNVQVKTVISKKN